MRRIILIHAWGETPKSCWYPWLKQQLEARGAEVIIPAMPNTHEPQIESWVAKLKEIAPAPDKDTMFIGHSIGCQTILRYFEQLSEDVYVGDVLFVAPWTHLKELDVDSQQIAKLWLTTPFDWQKAKAHVTAFTAFFSDNDEWVPLSEERVFQDNLGATTKVFAKAGHFDQQTEFPEVFTIARQFMETERIMEFRK